MVPCAVRRWPIVQAVVEQRGESAVRVALDDELAAWSARVGAFAIENERVMPRAGDGDVDILAGPELQRRVQLYLEQPDVVGQRS